MAVALAMLDDLPYQATEQPARRCARDSRVLFDVWESREQGQRFIDEQVMPIINELMAGQPEGSGGPPQRETYYELHELIRP